jgi:hypothetical protein
MHETTKPLPGSIPEGYCQCGCGLKTPLATETRPERNYVKGQPLRYLTGHQNRKYGPVPEGSKICARCGLEKPKAAFHLASNTFDGFSSRCKDCNVLYQAEWREKNRAKLNTAQRLRRLGQQFGISAADLLAMAMGQGGLCAICQRTDRNRTNKIGGMASSLAVDHDNRTGAVRALLCHHCNTGLGAFEDDPDLLQKALDYLKSHGR